MSGYYPLLTDKNEQIDLSLLDEKNPKKSCSLSCICYSCIYYCIEYTKIFIKNYFFIYLIFISSISFYYTSLIGCTSTFQDCQSLRYLRYYFNLAYLLLVSCIFFGLALTIHIIRRLNKINYLIFFSTYFYIFYKTQGTDFANHGTYNCISFIIFLPVTMCVFFLIYKLGSYCYNGERKKWFFIIVALIFSAIFLYHRTRCNHFYDGLGGEKINNDPNSDGCEFVLPPTCGLDLFSGLFNVNILRPRCEGVNDKKEVFMKYLDKSKNKYDKFYLPRTEHWNPKISYRNLANRVEQYIYDEDYCKKRRLYDREVSISFKDGRGTVDIKLIKNKTLIKERRKIAKNTDVKYNNIYILYLDAVSRNHFRRKLKKSSKVIEKMLYKNKKKEELYKNFNAFQFFKYYNFEGHTRGNNMPFIYGNSQFASTGISMTKFLKEKGYITCATQNSCNKELFDWSNSYFKDFEFSDWDHEMFALFCDPNYEDKKNKWSIVNGKCAAIRRCFYGRDSFDYSFDYVAQFLEAYKDERKFFKFMAGDGHEITLEVIKYIDNSLSKFLNMLLTNYTDDKTAIIIMSDHGAQMPGPYDAMFHIERWMEKYLGVFFLILPEKRNNVNYDNIYYNQQKFVTTYDIHDTLLDMINVNKMKYKKMDNKKGQSIFSKIDGTKRNCGRYKNEIKNYCYCKRYKK